MTVKLNHTIVHSLDPRAASAFFAELFGLPAPVPFGPFLDQIFGRIQKRGLAYWADPGRTQKGEINHHFGGRGVYFQDPSGHLLEIITKPYGSWDQL